MKYGTNFLEAYLLNNASSWVIWNVPFITNKIAIYIGSTDRTCSFIEIYATYNHIAI
jgi:hypothetical protein